MAREAHGFLHVVLDAAGTAALQHRLVVSGEGAVEAACRESGTAPSIRMLLLEIPMELPMKHEWG